MLRKAEMFSSSDPVFLSHVKDRVFNLRHFTELTHRPFSDFAFEGANGDQPYELTAYSHRKAITLMCLAMKSYEDFSGDFSYPINIMPNMNPQAVHMMFRGQQFNKFSKYGQAVNGLINWMWEFVNELEFHTVGTIKDLIEVDTMTRLTNRYDLSTDYTVVTENGAAYTTPERVVRVLFTPKELSQFEDIQDRYVRN